MPILLTIKPFSIQGGANALLHKEQSVAEILSGILQALNGGRPIAPQLSLLNQSQATQNPLPREQQAANALLLAGISEKQLEVLKCIAAGKVYKEIAVELNLSESTIKYHVERMQELLGKQNRNELLQHIYSIGFVKDRREDK